MSTSKIEELTKDEGEIIVNSTDEDIIELKVPHQHSAQHSLLRSSSRFIRQNDQLPIKIIGPDDEEILPEDIVIAPDGGWGWVIVFAAFFSNVIVDGTIYSFGVLLDSILKSSTKDNPVTVSSVAWVGSISTGLYSLAGPFVSAMSNVFGFRVTAVTGSIVAFSGLTLAWFFNRNAVSEMEGPNMTSLFICYGFIGGVGLSMLYVPSIITVGFYFEKRRALATGIAVAGSGIGTFLYVPFVQFLISDNTQVDWPKVILIEGFLLLSCVFVVSLYRPLKPAKSTLVQENYQQTLPSMHSGEKSLQMDLPLELQKPEPENTLVIVKYRRPNRPGDIFGLAPISSTTCAGFRPSQNDSELVLPGPKLLSQSQIGESGDPPEVASALRLARSRVQVGGWTMGGGPSIHHSGSKRMFLPKVTLVVTKPDDVITNESHVFRVGSKKTLNKPMYRSNIFYSGSLKNIPENTEHDEHFDNVEWEASQVLSVQVLPKKPKRKKCICHSDVLDHMLDFSLMKSLTLFLLALSGTLVCLGFLVPFIYLKAIVIEENHGLDGSEAAVLIAIIGVSNTIGRIICGFAGDRLSKQVLLINNLALTVGGTATILVPFVVTSYKVLIVYSIVFGLSIACFVSLRSIIIVELLGLDKLTNAFGLLLLFEGFASLIGTPLAGYLKELTGNYAASFYVAGSMIFLSGVVCYPLHRVNAWERKRCLERQRLKNQI